MGWQQIVAIAALCVAIVGLIITCVYLWRTREPGQHARPAYKPGRDYAADARRWREGAIAARATMEWHHHPLRVLRLPERYADGPADAGSLWHGPDAPEQDTQLTTFRSTIVEMTARQHLAAWYAAREEALTQQLLDVGAATWH